MKLLAILISALIALTSCEGPGRAILVSYGVAKVIENSSAAKREKRISDIREAAWGLQEFSNGKLPRASLDLLLNKLLPKVGDAETAALRAMIDGYLPAGVGIINPESATAVAIRGLAEQILSALPVDATK